MPYKVASLEVLDRIGEQAYSHLKYRFFVAPLIIKGNLPYVPVASFVDMMDSLRCEIQNIRPAMDRLACKGKIYQWFNIENGLIRYMYRPTDEELSGHVEIIEAVFKSMSIPVKKSKKEKMLASRFELLKEWGYC